MKPTIVPAILVHKFSDFKKQIKKIDGLFPYAQLDVSDGLFAGEKTFPEREEINDLKIDLPIELHLMVENPLAEIETWKNVKNVFRVIFHVETKIDHKACLNAIRANCWQAGLVLNPKTPLSAINPYEKLLNLAVFMAVFPGRQGAPFVPEVGDKIRQFAKKKNRPICAVDGGIKKENIAEVFSWGVEVFNIGSALVLAKNPQLALEEMRKEIGENGNGVAPFTA